MVRVHHRHTRSFIAFAFLTVIAVMAWFNMLNQKDKPAIKVGVGDWSGIEGIATIDSICPEAKKILPEECADRPISANFVILDDEGGVVTRFSSNQKGLFDVVIPPGFYTIQLDNRFSPPPYFSGVTVEVGKDKRTRVHLRLDSRVK
jgi:hypothetical protein